MLIRGPVKLGFNGSNYGICSFSAEEERAIHKIHGPELSEWSENIGIERIVNYVNSTEEQRMQGRAEDFQRMWRCLLI